MAELGGLTRAFGHAAVRHNRVVGKRRGLVDSRPASSGPKCSNAVIRQLGDSGAGPKEVEKEKKKRTVLPFKRLNHLHPRCMSAALELGGQERIHDIERQPFAHHAHANRKHVGIVVLADHAG